MNQLPHWVSILGVSLCFLATAGHGSAQMVFNVDTEQDAVDSNPGDGLCQTATAACSLRAAIQEANALPGAQTVEVSGGTHRLEIAGLDEDQGAQGDLDITDDLFLAGVGLNESIIDAQQHDRVFHVLTSATAELRGITIRGGLVATETSFAGGGIYNEGTLMLLDSSVENNRGASYGGGVYNTGELTIQGGSISSNDAADGGGVYNAGESSITRIVVSLNTAIFGAGISNANQLSLTGVIISDNDAAGGAGGFQSRSGTVSIHGSVIAHNKAFAWGGGFSGQTELAVTDTVVNGNMADSQAGLVIQSGKAVLDLVTVTDNQASDAQFGSAGGLSIANAIVTVSNSLIANNTVPSKGGGVFASGGTEPADLSISNSTVSGNRAATGGGILSSTGSTIRLNNVTVTENTGTGIGNEGGVLVLGNTIVSGNRNSDGSAGDCSGSLVSAGFNLIETEDGCSGVSGEVALDKVQVSAGLAPLADNGGITRTHALLEGSPAIDAGSPSAPGTGGASCEATDQRGISRPQGNTCDIGAYESSFSQSPPTPSPTPRSFPDTGASPHPSDRFPAPLAVAIALTGLALTAFLRRTARR
jgi:CSLREA domain-containing protein